MELSNLISKKLKKQNNLTIASFVKIVLSNANVPRPLTRSTKISV